MKRSAEKDIPLLAVFRPRFYDLRELEILLHAGSRKMGSNDIQTAKAISCGTSDGDGPPEVRHEIRYPLRARSEFIWVGRDGIHHEASGHSRDISEHGAYIFAKTCPPMGAMVRLVARFLNRRDPSRSRRIEMDGRVVRVELLLTNKAGWGFAVASTHSVLHEIDDLDGESRDE